MAYTLPVIGVNQSSEMRDITATVEHSPHSL